MSVGRYTVQWRAPDGGLYTFPCEFYKLDALTFAGLLSHVGLEANALNLTTGELLRPWTLAKVTA